ncbi:MAG: hypothetical protein ACT4PE_06325 [Candidatus Eiseniibacteriota bacterium]
MDRIPTPWIVWFLAATLTAASPVPRLVGLDGTICWMPDEAGSVACNAGGPLDGCCTAPCADATPCTDAAGPDAAAAGPPACNLCIACQCGISVIACPARLVPPAPEPVFAEAPPALPASLAFEPTAPPPEVLSKFS